MELADFRGAYKTGVTSMGEGQFLSALVIYDDGSVYINDTEVQGVTFDATTSKVTLPAFNINTMDVTAGDFTFSTPPPPGAPGFLGALHFRDVPWVAWKYHGRQMFAFPKPTLQNSVDMTAAFDTGDGLRLQASNHKWVSVGTGEGVAADATAKPSDWFAVTTTAKGIAISYNGKFWVKDRDVLVATASSVSGATIFTPLMTIEGALVFKSTADGKYVVIGANGALTLVNVNSLSGVAQFQGEAQLVDSATMMTRWNVREERTISQCDRDIASLCWQVTGGFFLALGLGPYMAASSDPKKLGVMGILRSSPPVWAKITQIWQAIADDPAISAVGAVTLVAQVMKLALEAGLLWKLIKFVLVQAGWYALFQCFSWVLSWLLAPELGVAELLASFATWTGGVIVTALAISRDCGQSFLPASAPA
ncbi:MAG: hypothetical protein JNM66_06495 [Bryobacterales bacterium]|nr:hypothetical protein [Bryobacterales bacterium]